jgi:hypothetical protein
MDGARKTPQQEVERPTTESQRNTRIIPPMPPEHDGESGSQRGPLKERFQKALATVGAGATVLTDDTSPNVMAPSARNGSEASRTNGSALSTPVVPRARQPEQVRPPSMEPTRAPAAPSALKPQRRAHLRLTRIDPWSVMKTSFLLSVAFGIVTIVSVLIVWTVLGSAGVWDSVNEAVQGVVGATSGSGFNIEDYLGMSRVLGFTALVAVIDVVLITAIATLSAFLYNMASALLGGLEVTLVEDH